MSRVPAGRLSCWSLTPLSLMCGVVCSAEAAAPRWLTVPLAVGSWGDLVRRIEARAYRRGFDDGADPEVAVGGALGRRLEALHRAAELDRWHRLVRWTAQQSAPGER